MLEKYYFLSAAGDITEVIKLDFSMSDTFLFIDSDNNSVNQIFHFQCGWSAKDKKKKNKVLKFKFLKLKLIYGVQYERLLPELGMQPLLNSVPTGCMVMVIIIF